MKDSEALAEAIKSLLLDWIEKGELVGDVYAICDGEVVGLQERKAWMQFMVIVTLELAEEVPEG